MYGCGWLRLWRRHQFSFLTMLARALMHHLAQSSGLQRLQITAAPVVTSHLFTAFAPPSLHRGAFRPADPCFFTSSSRAFSVNGGPQQQPSPISQPFSFTTTGWVELNHPCMPCMLHARTRVMHAPPGLRACAQAMRASLSPHDFMHSDCAMFSCIHRWCHFTAPLLTPCMHAHPCKLRLAPPSSGRAPALHHPPPAPPISSFHPHLLPPLCLPLWSSCTPPQATAAPY